MCKCIHHLLLVVLTICFHLLLLLSHTQTHTLSTLNHCFSSKHHHHHFSTEPCGSQLPHTTSWRHSGCGRTCGVPLWSAGSFSKRHIHLLSESQQLHPHLPLRPCGRYPPGEVVPTWLCVYSNPHSVSSSPREHYLMTSLRPASRCNEQKNCCLCVGHRFIYFAWSSTFFLQSALETDISPLKMSRMRTDWGYKTAKRPLFEVGRRRKQGMKAQVCSISWTALQQPMSGMCEATGRNIACCPTRQT